MQSKVAKLFTFAAVLWFVAAALSPVAMVILFVDGTDERPDWRLLVGALSSAGFGLGTLASRDALLKKTPSDQGAAK